MKQEMAKWIDLGLFPKVLRPEPGVCSDTPEETEGLLKIAKRFRANFETNYRS